MLIFQKNFDSTVPMIQNPYIRNRVQLPEIDGITPARQQPAYSVNSSDSHRPSLVNSSFNPALNDSLVGNPVARAVSRTRASETDNILIGDAQAQNESLLNKMIAENDAKERARAAASGATETIQDTPIIDTTPIEEDVMPERSFMDTAKVKATVATTNAKKAVKEGFSSAKDKAVEVAGKLSDAYGEGVTGSLAGDAALAAGGLALAGGAYHLLKKRRAKKKAEKEALEGMYKR